MKEKLKTFIVQKFPLARRSDFDESSLLLETGILDSLGILDVVSYIESEYRITLEDEDLVPENFQSVSSLAAFLEDRLASQVSRDEGEGGRASFSDKKVAGLD